MKGYFRKRGKKWSFTIDIGRDLETGKRKQKTLSGFNTKKEAEKSCAEMITQIENGLYVDVSKGTIKEFILQWMDTHAKQTLRESTFDVYKWIIDSHIIPGIGMITMDKITTLDIQKFLNKKKVDGLSSEYIKKMYNILHGSFEKAVVWGLIQKNIVSAAEPPRSESKDINTWNIEQASSFLEHTKGEFFHIAYVIAIYTGMRKGEILGLRWKDIDMEASRLSIRQTIYRTRVGLIFQEPKTKSSKRVVALPDIVIQSLKKQKHEQNKWKIQLGPAFLDHDLVVTNYEGKPVDPRNLTRHFTKMIKECELPKIRFHDLRHTHATIMLQLGEHPKVVSERLGHSRVAITMDTYSHVTPDMQKEASDKFAAAIQKIR